MFKKILLAGFLCTISSAKSFDTFLNEAINNSPYLKSLSIGVEQSTQEGSIITRYKNPNLEMEYSSFSPDTGDSDNGYRVNYSQPIRLWGVGSNNTELSQSIVENQQSSYNGKKAIFIRDISLKFTSYAKQKMLYALSKDELDIAKQIHNISIARYDSGSISKGVLLQAEVAYDMLEIKNETLAYNSNMSYYDLLKLSHVDKKIVLDVDYEFKVQKLLDHQSNPSIKILQSKQKQALAQSKVDSNKIEFVDVFAEYEKEPDQSVARVGVNIPLVFFNTKSQEKQISKLEAKRLKLLEENINLTLDIEMTRLLKERLSLERLYNKNKKVLVSELKLLKMFQEGYKIASINLLELQDIKNKVIATKRAIIQIKTALNQNAIYINYNQGFYNE